LQGLKNTVSILFIHSITIDKPPCSLLSLVASLDSCVLVMMATCEPTELGAQDLPTIPTVKEMVTWDKEKVLRWIQQRDRSLLEGDDLDDFKKAGTPGRAFVASNAERFRNLFGLSPVVCLSLDGLVDEVKKGKFILWMPLRPQLTVSKADSQQTGTASKKRRQEANQPPNRKRFRLSLLPGSDTIYETESAEVCYMLSFDS